MVRRRPSQAHPQPRHAQDIRASNSRLQNKSQGQAQSKPVQPILTHKERHTMNQTTPTSLLEVGDTYIQASWSHPDSSTEIIGIYQFLVEDGSPHWVMDQPLRGPWSIVKDGKVTQDTSIAKQAFQDTAYHAMALLLCLSAEGVKATKQAWAKEGGIVYDM